MRRLIDTAAALLLSAIAPTQNNAATTGPDPSAPRRPDPVLIDGVVATVGDAAILSSKIDSAAAGRIRSLEQQQGRPASREEMADIRGFWARRLIDTYELAQAAKTLGIWPPAQVEATIRDLVDKAEKEQVRTLGSYQRFSQELVQQHQTWDTFERDKRLEESSSLAEYLAVHQRLQQQRNLFITPQMLRDYYNKNRQLFVYGPQTHLAAVAFSIGDDAAAVMAQARAAATQWHEQELTAREVATAHKGFAPDLRELLNVTEDSRKNLQPFMVDFALQNQTGTVSAPITQGQTLWLLKVLEHRDAASGAFEDADVQSKLRLQLERLVEDGLRAQALRRARARTYVWTAAELR